MVNAWSLAASILGGTFDKDYPIMKKKEIDEKTGLWTEPEPYYGYENPLLSQDVDMSVGAGNTASENTDIYSNDGLDYEVDFYNDNFVDDQYAHHFITEEKSMAHYFKYHEKEILKDIEEYVSGTYQGHYTGNSHEFRNVQTLDLMASKDLASAFCQANILKYGSRYGNKDGKNKKDLLKVIHYAMLLAHFDGHYGEPSMPSGNFDQMP